MNKKRLAFLAIVTLLAQPCAMVLAEDTSMTSTTTDSTSLTYAQQQAIQQDITNGITNGTLSQAQIEALQQQLANGTASNTRPNRSGFPAGEGSQPYNSQSQVQNNNSPIDRRTTTGPDPFTYNTLGPDAYQSQKYQNPAYNVPAYPTTDPQTIGTTQQYSAPTNGTGVFVYRPPANR